MIPWQLLSSSTIITLVSCMEAIAVGLIDSKYEVRFRVRETSQPRKGAAASGS